MSFMQYFSDYYALDGDPELTNQRVTIRVEVRTHLLVEIRHFQRVALSLLGEVGGAGVLLLSFGRDDAAA